VRSSAASGKQLLAVHADACSSSSISSSTTNATAATSAGRDSAAAAAVAQVVVVQLVHAVSGAKADKQYQFELGTLKRLHDSTSGSEQCALLNMLQPPPGWSLPAQQQHQQQQQRVVELKYDGKPAHNNALRTQVVNALPRASHKFVLTMYVE
jgi:hypothetical protein